MAKKIKKQPALEEIMELVNLDKRIADLQMQKKNHAEALYAKYGRTEVVIELARATKEGDKFLRLSTDLVVTEKIEAKYTFLKKEPKVEN